MRKAAQELKPLADTGFPQALTALGETYEYTTYKGMDLEMAREVRLTRNDRILWNQTAQQEQQLPAARGFYRSIFHVWTSLYGITFDGRLKTIFGQDEAALEELFRGSDLVPGTLQ